ncbi:phosphopyruvate hydratase [bacterium]|jgi:enolase|nr:phosphopyruvate hydratase [bacterium]MDP6756548.1 phosphopyruvate hydratase [Patescibacteria group bacterium]|tara:strand:+ start:6314 stop:7582 length:1269 start_codon:yes stop_codon:yes gene_type:complete
MNQFEITHIESGEILDSRGDPTVMATVGLASGAKSAAAVPSGASVGAFEAHELRDENPDRYNGKGVIKACSNINVRIAKELIGEDAQDQERIDRIMVRLDGTDNKSKLGANAILAVSLAVSRAVSVARSIPLHASLQKTFNLKKSETQTIPIMNLVNGGMHGDTNLAIQEFQIIPIKGESISKRIETASELFHSLADELKKNKLDSDVGNEGGYSPDVESLEDIFHMLGSIVIDAGLTPGEDILFGIDAAANSFYDKSKKTYTLSPPSRDLSASELREQYEKWIHKFHISSIEDPFYEEAWDDWKSFSSSKSINNTLVIGDDLIATNKNRLKKAIKEKSINAVLVKPNQIGTLSETIEVIKLAQKHNLAVVISHRSGETNDTFISDLAVGVGAEYLKAGAPSRGERVAKYNRLMEIEKELNT